MQVTETNTDGLSRGFTIVVPASDIDDRVQTRLKEVGRKARLPGFRPGKVPMQILKQRFGRSVMGEVLEGAVNETSRKAIDERGLRPATQPKIEIKSFEEGSDLEFEMHVEVLPEIGEVDLSGIELERLKAEVTDDVVMDAVNRIAEGRKSYEKPAKARAAKEGDQLLVTFTGHLDGEQRAEMSGEDREIVLGSNQFIPGFEEQLVGAKDGQEKTVELTFPADYPSAEHAGKPARFDVLVKEVRAPRDASIDDEFAKGLGFDNLEALKGAVRQQTEAQYAQASRNRMKRQLLDKLAERFDFAVPPGMVEMEFDQIWRQVEEALKHHRETKDDPEHQHHHPHDPELDKPEEELRADYRAIAERRVRLGLLLADVGQRSNVQVTQDELNRALSMEARRYPGQEQQVIEFFRNNPQAIDSIRAPLFEDKVVDYVIETAKVTEKPVSAEELLRDPDEEPAPQESKPAAKKSGGQAKKAGSTKAEASDAGTAEKPAKTAAKKPAAKKASASTDDAAKGSGAAKKPATKTKSAAKDGEKD